MALTLQAELWCVRHNVLADERTWIVAGDDVFHQRPRILFIEPWDVRKEFNDYIYWNLVLTQFLDNIDLHHTRRRAVVIRIVALDPLTDTRFVLYK